MDGRQFMAITVLLMLIQHSWATSLLLSGIWRHSDDRNPGAFISQPTAAECRVSSGPLSKFRLAIKDNLDVGGYVTEIGHPKWAETHPAAWKTAPAVQVLLNSGACFVGKTQLAELAASLTGVNVHYGTPANPVAPGRLPGGSSSGSAVAVAAGLADIALGTDTGGSMRVPASHTGIYGIRPTHGRVPLEGVVPLAPMFDTVGWFARDPVAMRRVGEVLLDPSSTRKRTIKRPRGLIINDLWALAEHRTQEAMRNLFQDNTEAVEEVLGKPIYMDLSSFPDDLKLHHWPGVYLSVQGYQAWQYFGPWLKEHKPVLGPLTRLALDPGALLTEKIFQEARAARERIRGCLLKLLGDDGLLILPTAPGPAPPVSSTTPVLGAWSLRALGLTCIASLGGLPEVSVPLLKVDGLPVGLSLVGPPGSDEELLRIAEELVEAMKK